MAQAEVEKTIPVNAKKFFQVIADYEKYPQFVDGMKSVKLVREGGKVHASYEVSMMGKEISYTVSMTENEQAGKLSWTLAKSDFFKKNDGAWTIVEVGPNECKVKYSLDIEFNFSVPGFILKGLIKTSLPAMVDSFAKRAQNV